MEKGELDMAQVTSAEAVKYLRKLGEQRDALLAMEKKAKSFTAAIQEDTESVRPAYDYKKVQDEIEELEGKIRQLKHSINCFNISCEVPGFNMTIDQMLVYIPQLTGRKKKLETMKARLPKERVNDAFSRGGSIIEYNYANYDIAAVEADYNTVSDELARAQNALDTVNATVQFEAEIS